MCIRDRACDVRVVQRRLDLVEEVERARPRQEEREQERDRAQRLLAAREQREPGHALAARPELDLDARPCPFYLLDFVELLRRYSESAQFIVVTHQKKTMEAADVLYGVTMGGDGVSQIVSRRLPREERATAVA